VKRIPQKLNLLLIAAALSSCQPVGVVDQARLSGGVFDFAGSGAAVYGCGLTSQIETGRAAASTVTAGGCSACQ
jgi:hypothetical protein